MNYQQFTYSLIRAESGTANTQPIAVSQPYLEIEQPQMESSSCCCCCCCCQNSICCQCMCHSGMCCQGNCQLMPTTLTTVNVQEQVAIADELNPPKTTRHIRRDKSSIQIKPNAIDTTNTRLNLKLKGSQSSHNIFKNNNMSSYNRNTYTTYNRQERHHPQLTPSIENERRNNNDNASLPNVAVPPLNAQSEGMKHRSKSFVNVVNTTNDGVYIEEEFHLSHPTVSGLLARLEKKGFLEFRADGHDRRCKRIFMLPKGRQCMDTMHRTILENEERLVRGFSQTEKEQFMHLLERAIGNMDIHPCGRSNKEEKGQ